jgi:hypothetical protein
MSNIPCHPVSALAKNNDNAGLIESWQRANRARREKNANKESGFIYWTHYLTLGYDSDLASFSARKKDTDSYFAGILGIVIFPIIGLPVLCFRGARRLAQIAYYGE